MITQIKGRLVEKSPTELVIDCNGIGYLVNISLNTFSLLSDSESISLYTHLQVKEDSHTLFGFFDKSLLIDMFKLILQGEENRVIEIYRKIYDQGVEPKVFINDFLELVYYFKNIDSLTLESTNFSLNDEEFSKIKEISNKIDNQILILFWQFTIKTLDELDIVSNQNLSIEMFLMRLMYLIDLKSNNNETEKNGQSKSIKKEEIISDFKNDTINQIKNISQEKKTKPQIQTETKAEDKNSINSFNDLIKICTQNREVKLKFELEKNVNLVSFEKNRLEISFNDNLDKNFVKDLSLKLFEWTGERWIISFSKSIGEISIREKENNKKIELLKNFQNSELYKHVREKFPDANLVEIIPKKEHDE